MLQHNHVLHKLLSHAYLDPHVVFESLEKYTALLSKWNGTTNLIGRSTEVDIVSRHLIDSAQLLPYLPPETETLTDFGSGAGFPGIILALAGVPNVHLVESNRKKAAFLNEASRLCPNRVTIHTDRIESLVPWETDVITARALAPLDRLLAYSYPFYQQKKCLPLYLKGSTLKEEILLADICWSFDYVLHQSMTDNSGQIIALFHMEPKE